MMQTPLRRLMRECGDEERTFRFESALVKRAEHRETLLRLARERAAFVRQLQKLEPPSDRKLPGGSLLHSLDRAARALRALLGVRTDGDALAHARRSLGRTGAMYDLVIAMPGLEPHALLVLAAQHALIVDEHRELAYAQFS